MHFLSFECNELDGKLAPIGCRGMYACSNCQGGAAVVRNDWYDWYVS